MSLTSVFFAAAAEPGEITAAHELAKLTGAPVLMVGLACKPCVRLPSWDRTVLPLPFGRAAMVWDGPITLDKDADNAAIAAEWTERLNAVTERAEVLLR